MNKRGTGIFIFQIILAVIGLAGLCFLVYMFIPAAKVLIGKEANLGEVIGTVLLFLPFVIMASPIVSILGIIIFVIALKQRKNPDTKDAFSLIMTIFGLILLITPVVMVALFFIASNSKSEETALFIGNYLFSKINLLKI
ncbi:MAG: hypothetical protein K6E21_03110 [Bacilli bacterium]|nr:hypothetical protein [Bacilli bacterium]